MSLPSPTSLPPSVNPLDLLPKVPSLDNTFGSFLIATFIGLIMYGLTLHQTYRYYRLFPGDALVLRMIVVCTLLLETLHIVLCMHVCYYYLVTNYFDPTALLDGVWSIRILPVSTAAIIVVSESFFTRRVYLIGSHFRMIVAIVPILMLVILGFGTAATVKAFILPTFAEFKGVAWMTSAGFGVAVVVDSLLTGTLILALRRSRTGFRRTDSLIDVLIIYAVNTGLLTGIFSLLSFIFAIVAPGNLIYSAFNLISAKLYANSLLAVLNSRKALMDRVQQDCFGTSSFDLSAVRQYDSERAAQARWNVPRLGFGRSLSFARAAVPTKSTTTGGTVLDIRVHTAETRAYDQDVESVETGSRKGRGLGAT
ncbi:hypothetical protein C8Q77DRAFT_1155841 [Trametes polyzona]|nr:hypothetical protein C8Q77DRAFT_1155841 [Trametes polyzona]